MHSHAANIMAKMQVLCVTPNNLALVSFLRTTPPSTHLWINIYFTGVIVIHRQEGNLY